MADELTKQQMNTIMTFVNTAMMQQKFGSEKGEMKETGLKSLTDLENQIKDMNDVTGRFIRGFRDLIKFPKHIDQVFTDIEKIVHDSTSSYAETINKMSKINLESIRVHGANSDAIKNQTKGLLKSVHALSDFKDNAKKYNEIADLITKTNDRKQELERKPATGTTASEKLELANIKSAELARDQFKKDINAQIDEIKEVLAGDNSLTDEMKQAFEQYKSTLNAIHESIRAGEQISAEDLKISDELLAVNKAQLQTISVANTQFKEYLQSSQAQGKAMALAIGAMTISIGSRSVSAILSRQGANLTNVDAMTAGFAGMSPAELHDVAKSNATELGLFSGKADVSAALHDRNAIEDLKNVARIIGLEGPEALKAASQIFNMQLRTGTYNEEQTKQERLAGATNYMRAIQSMSGQLQMSPVELLSELDELQSTGGTIPFIEEALRKDKNLAGDDLLLAMLDNIKAVKGNIKQLGLNNDYLKRSLASLKSAGEQSLEQFVRGQIGVSMGASVVGNFIGEKFSPEDLQLMKLAESTKDRSGFTPEQFNRLADIEAAFALKKDQVIKNYQQNPNDSKAYSDFMQLMAVNQMRAAAPTSSFLTDESIAEAKAQKPARDKIQKSSTFDDTGKLISSIVQNMNVDPDKLVISDKESMLLDAASYYRGATESPVGAPIATALSAAGAGAAGVGGTIATFLTMWKLKMLGGATGSGRIGGILKVLTALGVGGAAMYGTNEYLKGDTSGSGGVGGTGILGPNGELINATFSIQHAILNIGNTSQKIESDGKISNATSGNIGIPQNGNFSDVAIAGTGLAATGLSLAMLKTSVAKSVVGGYGGKAITPLYTAMMGMMAYNRLGEETDIGRAERVGGAVGNVAPFVAGSMAFGKAAALVSGGNPWITGGASIVGGMAAQYYGEEFVEQKGRQIGSGFDYLTDSTAELFWQIDKFNDKLNPFLSDAERDPLVSNPIIEWMEDHDYSNGLPSKVLAAQEQKMASESKKEDSDKLDLNKEEVKSFLEKATNFFEKIISFGDLFSFSRIKDEEERQKQEALSRDPAASTQARIDSFNSAVTTRINKSVGRAKERTI